MNDKLFGKTIVWDGDSICAGKHFDDTREDDAFAGRIAKRHSMTYKNYSVGGGTITENVIRSNGEHYHSVSATLERMQSEFPNADYVIFEGGTNDADLFVCEQLTPERLGSFTPDDYSGNYDRNTFCGALESLFFRASQYWKGKKIGYIVAHKMGPAPEDLPRRRGYFETAIAICKKWGIPYLDLWEKSYLNPLLPHMFDPALDADGNVKAGSFYADGQHLTAKGYDILTDIIDPWLNSL